MLNPFDRKNLPLNKALSQMNTDNELLNREEIEQETLSKIAYVSKHHKLRRILKPSLIFSLTSDSKRKFFRDKPAKNCDSKT